MRSKLHIAVIGAGAFGGWTALHLLESGARVTLVDAWGPGNSRASSGGETRIMRCAYGGDQRYTEMAARALKLWAKYERKWKRKMLHRCGVLWMAGDHDDSFERESVKMLKKVGVKFEKLAVAKMAKRWPQVNFAGVEWGIFEPESGYLEARASCATVVQAFVAQGGAYRQAAIQADGIEDALMRSVRLSDGSKLKADAYVFACGPWLGKIFPRTIGELISPTKQDVLFFGTPWGDTRFSDGSLPVWGDHYVADRAGKQEARFVYGIPGSDRRGFKVADDTRGPEFDPTSGERVINVRGAATVREYIGVRFPALKDAPLVETRVCQYEQSPDGNFILDRHPERENVWIVGGGSGHGFKHGPALGEMVAGAVLGRKEIAARWGLQRFRKL